MLHDLHIAATLVSKRYTLIPVRVKVQGERVPIVREHGIQTATTPSKLSFFQLFVLRLAPKHKCFSIILSPNDSTGSIPRTCISSMKVYSYFIKKYERKLRESRERLLAYIKEIEHHEPIFAYQ